MLGAALVAVIAVLSAWAHHSMSTTRPGPSNPATTLPANAALAAPLPPPPQRNQLRAWREEAEPSMDVLLVAAAAVVGSATQGDIAGTGAACQTTADATTSVLRHLPSPDPTLNTALQHAVDDYQAGVRHCISGTKKEDAVDILRGAGLVSQGKVDLLKAYDILEADLSPDSGDPVLTV